MLIYFDQLVKLEYAIAQEIIFIELQDHKNLGFEQIKKVCDIISVYTRKYEAKGVVLDFSRTDVLMSVAEYKSCMAKLAVELGSTNVLKVARISTNDAIREQKVASIYVEILKIIQLPLKFRSFTNKDEAVRWLME